MSFVKAFKFKRQSSKAIKINHQPSKLPPLTSPITTLLKVYRMLPDIP